MLLIRKDLMKGGPCIISCLEKATFELYLFIVNIQNSYFEWFNKTLYIDKVHWSVM